MNLPCTRFRTTLVVAIVIVLGGVALGDTLSLSSPSPNTSSSFGESVAGVPDVDGDGRGDIVVGSPGETVGGLTFAGRVHVFSGATGTLIRSHSSPNAIASGNFGWRVAGVPDANGDGRGDMIVGAPFENPGGVASAGRAYLFSGATGTLLRTFVSPNAEASGLFGSSVAGVPDMNLDGRGDVVIGAYAEDPGASPGGAGRAYVYSGSSGALLFTLVSPNEENNGAFGYSVAGVSDANDDGRGDVVVGAYQEDPGASPGDAGRAYLISGATGAVLRTFASPNEQGTGYFGYSVASGKITDDSRGDVVIGAWGEDPGGVSDAGRAYAFNGFTGAAYYTYISLYPEINGRFGYRVACVPDVNSDARDDALIGAPNEDPSTAPADSGRAYLFRSGLSPPIRVFVSPNEEASGSFGWSVAGMSDADGDGRGDVIISAREEDPGALPNSAGMAYRYGMAKNQIIVRAGATGANDGSSWANGWTDLQAAIDFVVASNFLPAEIWVSAGTYTPEPPGGDINLRFEMASGIALYGGFAGNETLLSQRNPAVNVTILSGDLNGNDGPNFTNYSDNSLTVVRSIANDATAILDGFTIRGGNTTGSGGGVAIVTNGTPTVVNCVIKENRCGNFGDGGGMVVSGSPSISNCTFSGNHSQSDGGGVYISAGSPTFTNCNFTGNSASDNSGGGMRIINANATLVNCNFTNNSAPFGGGLTCITSVPATLSCNNVTFSQNIGTFNNVWLRYPVLIQSGIWLQDGELRADGVTLGGTDSLQLDSTAFMTVTDTSSLLQPLALKTILTADVFGTGRIVINNGATLEVHGGAEINMDPIGGSVCVTDDAPSWGNIDINGTLLLKSGKITHTNITVNNDVSIGQCGNDTGGKLVLEQSAATLECNKITTYGDRYAIFSPTLNPAPTILNNKVTAIITPDLSPTEEGELFELRQLDSVCPACPSGLNLLSQGNGAYNNTWALDELRLLAGAKLNLTNRPGFVFSGSPESLFAKKVTLYPGAILNTAFQRLYYGSLVNESGQTLDPQNLPVDRDVKDIPFLGFSLGVITFENDCEFEVRLRKRTLGTNGQSGTISRITSNVIPPIPPGAGGVMHMRTNNANSIASKGAFNKQAEDKVLVTFKYLWPVSADPGELWVYLSDSPDIGTNLTPIGVVNPPANPTDPGGPSSNRFGVFHGRFPRTQDLSRGTYVELELRNSNSRVWIDDFDPVVCIWCQCGDLSGEGDCGITAVDYLYLLSEYGNPVNDLNNCADQMGRDNYVDLADLLAWSSQYHNTSALNLCDGPSGSAGGSITATSVLGDKPIIAGKRNTAAQPDALYPLNLTTHTTDAGINAPVASAGKRSGNGRLVPGPDGEMYQLHGSRGLIKLSDGSVQRAPARFCNFPTSGTITRIGPTQPMTGTCTVAGGGYAMADTAFDPNDVNRLYLAPVEVIPQGGTGSNCPYPAGLMLQRDDSASAFLPVQIYGDNPAIGSSVTIPPGQSCSTIVYSPDRSRVREIEVDEYGNVFILAAQQILDNDYLLVYPASGGMLEFSLAPIEAPTALHYANDHLYFTTSLDGPDTDNTTLYRLSLQRGGAGSVAGVLFPPTSISVNGIRAITSIATNPADDSLVAVGFLADTCNTVACQTESPCPGSCVYGSSDTIFVTPKMITVATPITSPAVDVFDLSGADLSLPIDVAFMVTPLCGTGDFNSDGVTTALDTPLFAAALVNPQPADLCPGDMNGDGKLDGKDIRLFIDQLSNP